LAHHLADTDPKAAATLLKEIERDVQQALHETAQLAQRIHPPLLEAGGLAAALRAAAASVGIPVSVEVEVGLDCPPEATRTIYLCCLGVLEHAGADARVTIKVRTEEKAIAFEVAEDGALSPAAAAPSDAQLDPLRDRVEALGGRLTVRSEAGRGIRMSGLLPFSR
jgi:signal transduction histidine kinase